MTNSSQDTIRAEVLSCSQNWVKNFNQGKAEACIAAYDSEAVMRAKPMGTFIGKEAIAGFWKPFIASGARDLEYYEVNIEILNDSTALLSAHWRMNIGRGVITKEKWVKHGDGNWLLEEDDFEVMEKF